MKVEDGITENEIRTYWEHSAEQLGKAIANAFSNIASVRVSEPTEEEKEEEKEEEPTPLKCEYNKHFNCAPRERLPPYAWDIYACFQCLSDRMISLERKQIQTEHKLMLKMNRR